MQSETQRVTTANVSFPGTANAVDEAAELQQAQEQESLIFFFSPFPAACSFVVFKIILEVEVLSLRLPGFYVWIS